MRERRVEVMWMDASRAEAHKLDFFLEEWRLRREEVSREERPLPPLAVRDYTSPPSIETSIKWRSDLLQRLGKIEAWLSRKNVEGGNGGKYLPFRARLARAEFVGEKNYVLACLRSLKDFMRSIRRGPVEELLEEIQGMENPTIELLGREHTLIKNMVRSGRITFAPEEQAVIDAVDEFLEISLHKED